MIAPVAGFPADLKGSNIRNNMKIVLLQTLVFLAAFLIFQVELILGKVILPGYGGGYLIWGISLVFYQGLLFLGYFYVHVFSRRFLFAQFRVWQSALLLLSLLFLPLSVARLQSPAYALPTAVEIVQLLFMTVGFVFLVLSSISVYVQIHLHHSHLPERENPYILYAGSNLGAFMGLLTYPFLFEPNLDLSLQLHVWEFSYAVLVVLFMLVQWIIPLRVEANPGAVVRTERSRWGRWLLLSAAGSAMFLAITNELTFNFAPVPFLWILPLGIYLLTLVLSFKRTPFCPQAIQSRFYLFATIGVLLSLFKLTGNNPLEYLVMVLLGLQLPWYTLAIVAEPLLLLVLCFLFCLVCHYRLNQDKPEDPGQLTTFYLVISIGGFLGGALVNWMVPLIFNVTPEFLIAVLLAALGFSRFRPVPSLDKKYFVLSGILILALVVAWPGLKTYLPMIWNKMVTLAILGALFILFYFLQDKHFQFALVVLGLIAVLPLLDLFAVEQKGVFKKRNYYGVYKVYDEGGYRLMRHGTILHGAQILDEPGSPTPLVYYHRNSPIGEVLSTEALGLARVAMVGLGAGTLAAYARDTDRYDYFELDPLVGEMAQKYFSFISRSRGTVQMIYGDARVSLRKIDAGQYDAVIVDVFNSGSIPVHMMTVEALEDFRRVMKPGGTVFFHISNLYMNLAPVVQANAGIVGMSACIKETGSLSPPAREATVWVAVSENKQACSLLESSLQWRELRSGKPTQPWTDRYSSIFSAIMN